MNASLCKYVCDLKTNPYKRLVLTSQMVQSYKTDNQLLPTKSSFTFERRSHCPVNSQREHDLSSNLELGKNIRAPSDTTLRTSSSTNPRASCQSPKDKKNLPTVNKRIRTQKQTKYSPCTDLIPAISKLLKIRKHS
jgi:hypothetical protein